MNELELSELNNHKEGCPCKWCPSIDDLKVGDKVIAKIIDTDTTVITTEILDIGWRHDLVLVQRHDGGNWWIAIEDGVFGSSDGHLLCKVL